MLSQEQKRLCMELYAQGVKVRDIMARAGIGSAQTVYRIVGCDGGTARAGKRLAQRISVTLDAESADVLREVAPANVSAWICDLIKSKYKKMRESRGG